MVLGCFFAVIEVDIPKMLPPPSACWVIRFSELQKGRMIQRFGWRGDPGQAACGEPGGGEGLTVRVGSFPTGGSMCTWRR